jgi:thioredoxin-dependent peroxiredoxin
MPQLAVGDLAPDFSLPAADGNRITLSDLRDRSVIIFFFPAAMTPGCTLEAGDFQGVQEQLAEAGYQVLGISPDTVAALARFAAAQGLTYPLGSDVDRAVLQAYGAWGEKKLYGKTIEGVIRSTVAVDPEGRVVLAQYNVKATGHVGRLRRDLGLDR